MTKTKAAIIKMLQRTITNKTKAMKMQAVSARK